MVNTEKPERDCKRWRSVFDRDGGEEQCSRTTICTVVVWGVLETVLPYDDFACFCRDEDWARERSAKIYIRKELRV